MAEFQKIAEANDASAVEAQNRVNAQARFAHDFEVWKVTAPLQNATELEMFKSVLEAGQTALRSAIIINGGAAAALLAYLGNLMANPTKTGIAYPIQAINGSMLIFVIGVGLAGVATGVRYLT